MPVDPAEFVPDARSDISAELQAARKTGQSFAWVGKRPPGPDGEVIAKYLSSPMWPFSPADYWQFTGAPGQLRAISQAQATARLRNCLHRGMAYNVEVMNQETATRLATIFVGLLSADASWWTNTSHERDDGRLAAFSPLTDATFDSGVIGVARDSLAIAWFADED